MADRRRATQGRVEFYHAGVGNFLHAADMRQINDITAMAAKKKLPRSRRASTSLIDSGQKKSSRPSNK